MSREALTGADRGGGRRGHPLHLRRDLSRARLCLSGGDRGGVVAACARDQFLLEIFLHDRLAGRLDGGAGAAGPPDRTAAAESRDLGADAVADRGRSRLRRREEMEAIKRGYLENRRILIEGLPTAGLDQFPARRRRILPLRRRLRLHLRQFRLRQADAGGGACRGDPRRRLRSVPRRRISSASPTRARPTTCARRWQRIARWLRVTRDKALAGTTQVLGYSRLFAAATFGRRATKRGSHRAALSRLRPNVVGLIVGWAKVLSFSRR